MQLKSRHNWKSTQEERDQLRGRQVGDGVQAGNVIEAEIEDPQVDPGHNSYFGNDGGPIVVGYVG